MFLKLKTMANNETSNHHFFWIIQNKKNKKLVMIKYGNPNPKKDNHHNWFGLTNWLNTVANNSKAAKALKNKIIFLNQFNS